MATQDQQRNSEQSKTQTFKIKGMKTDFSESSFENDFAFENKNMRINIVDEDNTLMNLTNERGTKFVGTIEGIPIGVKKFSHDKALVITTTNEGASDVEVGIDTADDVPNVVYNSTQYDVRFNDRIYEVDADLKGVEAKLLYENTDTNFSAHHPLEIEHYNDGDKDSFYLADGINNFKTFAVKGGNVLGEQRLDYNKEVSGSERIYTTVVENSAGEFYSGVLQYAFCYVTKQGHITNIIDTSSLIPLTLYGVDRGLAPNTRCNVSIKIQVRNIVDFDRIEIYSLFRSTLNGEITVRVVDRPQIQKIVTEVDTPVGIVTEVNYLCQTEDLNKGSIISYQELLTRFNSTLIPSTIAAKGGALFLGNIHTNNYTNLGELIGMSKDGTSVILTESNDAFLSANTYYYGIQLQDKYGQWSPVMYIGKRSSVSRATVSSDYVAVAKKRGYVSFRIMLADDKRVRKTVAEGITTKCFKFEDGKYGVDYYSAFFPDRNSSDIHSSYKLQQTNDFSDFYSPDIEFDENLVFQNGSKLQFIGNEAMYSLKSHKYDVTIEGNTAVAYNNNDTAKKLGTIEYIDGRYLWNDAIESYQKALQITFCGVNVEQSDEDAGDVLTPLYRLKEIPKIKEAVSKYVVYALQPSGSLNDSDGKTSVLRNKRISRKYSTTVNSNYMTSRKIACWLFDGTSNNIPLKEDNNILVYAGIVNQKVYGHNWKMDVSNNIYKANISNTNEQFWDDDQVEAVKNFTLATMQTLSYVGQPIEFYVDDYKWRGVHESYKYLVFQKAQIDFDCFVPYNTDDIIVRDFRGTFGTSLGSIALKVAINYLNNTTYNFWNYQLYGLEYGFSDRGKGDGERTGFGDIFRMASIVKLRVTDNHNRPGTIGMTYKTPKHLVLKNVSDRNCIGRLVLDGTANDLNDFEIENSRWIVCSTKHKLPNNSGSVYVAVDIDEKFTFNYELLKTEPYSANDNNQITCVLNASVNSYINPLCRYDNLVGLDDYNGVTSDVFNKINLVYNQKNNFFVYSGITGSTVTEDVMNNTLLYSDVKVDNEKEDSWVNFNTTNFYTLDSYIKPLNKLINFNDKLLSFSANAIVQVLYDENVVINTDSIQSLGLASTDKITGTQLVSNSYGCLNKWSIGIFNNVLYFSDDINRKLMAYNNEFVTLNETLGIETLNGRLLKNRVWNPVDWCNTKLNIDALAKDVHYTGSDIDIALNDMIGNYTSLYSYEAIPYIETIGQHSVAFRNTDKFNTELWLMRQGDYNYFFDKFEQYWTTVIMNHNSLMNKMMSNIEFSTEAYDGLGANLTPNQNFTFDHVTFWNDYQSNKMLVNYKMYGQSLLKKKFRIWRINRFRDSSRMLRRNYDRMANTWHYLKLSSEIENNNKLTLHWLNINYL